MLYERYVYFSLLSLDGPHTIGNRHSAYCRFGVRLRFVRRTGCPAARLRQEVDHGDCRGGKEAQLSAAELGVGEGQRRRAAFVRLRRYLRAFVVPYALATLKVLTVLSSDLSRNI
jgi:hypothetical protein